MRERNRVYAFLIKQYGIKAADTAIVNFGTKKTKYINQGN